ncbi:MAG: hypothetical protein IH852_14810 [Bacteroidetes bacterium]|nr:hypothetical protein [Bacteroidota bacterium]
MVHELKKNIENGKVFFGVKQTLKNAKNLKKVILPSDCRMEIRELLDTNKIAIEELEFGKQDLSNKLELEFECEVFGLKK